MHRSQQLNVYPRFASALLLILQIFRFAHHSIAPKMTYGLLLEKSAKVLDHSKVGCPRNEYKKISVQTENNRNKICFAFVSVHFRNHWKFCFGLFRCFGCLPKQPKQIKIKFIFFFLRKLQSIIYISAITFYFILLYTTCTEVVKANVLLFYCGQIELFVGAPHYVLIMFQNEPKKTENVYWNNRTKQICFKMNRKNQKQKILKLLIRNFYRL